jgi:hypothetical protein
MAHLWIEHEGEWNARGLDGAEFVLAAEPSSRAPRLIQTGTDGATAWALVAAPDSNIRVNGRTAHAGLQVLDDRDEIRAGASRFFFSAESLAVVVPFPGAARAVYCGRCRLPIDAGAPAVCCPGDKIWYHQGGPENRLCWTYAPTCNYCPTQTALDAGLKWRPEE